VLVGHHVAVLERPRDAHDARSGWSTYSSTGVVTPCAQPRPDVGVHAPAGGQDAPGPRADVVDDRVRAVVGAGGCQQRQHGDGLGQEQPHGGRRLGGPLPVVGGQRGRVAEGGRAGVLHRSGEALRHGVGDPVAARDQLRHDGQGRVDVAVAGDVEESDVRQGFLR